MHLKILGYCQIPNENFDSHLSNLHQIIDLVIPVIINSLLRQPNVLHLFFIYLTKIYNVPIILESIKLHGPALKLLAQNKGKNKQLQLSFDHHKFINFQRTSRSSTLLILTCHFI